MIKFPGYNEWNPVITNIFSKKNVAQNVKFTGKYFQKSNERIHF